jgi:hypothetical protein
MQSLPLSAHEKAGGRAMILTPLSSWLFVVVCVLLAYAAWRLIMFDAGGNKR